MLPRWSQRGCHLQLLWHLWWCPNASTKLQQRVHLAVDWSRHEHIGQDQGTLLNHVESMNYGVGQAADFWDLLWKMSVGSRWFSYGFMSTCLHCCEYETSLYYVCQNLSYDPLRVTSLKSCKFVGVGGISIYPFALKYLLDTCKGDRVGVEWGKPWQTHVDSGQSATTKCTIPVYIEEV